MGTVGFLFWSAVLLAPAYVAALAARSASRDRLPWAVPVAAVVGFLIGAVIGWASVPAAWTASLWTTIVASGDSITYGHSFEHAAEQVLMYVFFSAALGELSVGLAALLFVWRVGPRVRATAA